MGWISNTYTENGQIYVKIPEKCSGCLTSTAGCDVIVNFSNCSDLAKECPCKDCLIKSMCKNGCKDFSLFSIKARNLFYNKMEKIATEDVVTNKVSSVIYSK